MSIVVTSLAHLSRSVSLTCTPKPAPAFALDTALLLFARHECFSIMKHSSSIDAKIFANINKGEEDGFSTHTGAGFLGKIFDMSSKQRAAETVSKATLGEKKACVAISLQTSSPYFWISRRSRAIPKKFRLMFFLSAILRFLNSQELHSRPEEGQDEFNRAVAQNTCLLSR